VGLTCLAEALAGSGDLDRALGVLKNLAPAAGEAGYRLAVRGELRERAGDDVGAIADYRAALAAAPGDDSIRAALADALAARGRDSEAFGVLDVERPSLALVVRQAIVAPPARRKACETRAAEWLSLEAARGDAIHLRETALLALSRGDTARSLEAARANFENQRELADVRVFARAAAATRDAGGLARIGEWLAATGFRDVVTERVLDREPRS
jgi:hypothetical protein